MRKLLSLLMATVLLLGVLPMVVAVGTTGGVDVDVDDPDAVCEAPKIYVDPTSALFVPNAENTETAVIYDTAVDNAVVFYPYDATVATIGYQGDYRSDYIFTGEIMRYWTAVYDANGEDDIVGANVLVAGVNAAVCTLDTDAAVIADVIAYLDILYPLNAPHAAVDADIFLNDNFDFPVAEAYDSTGGPADTSGSYAFYRCDLLAVATQLTEADVTFNTVDGGEVVCVGTPTTVVADWDDTLDFNPTLLLTLTGAPIDFGSVQEGSVALSNTVTLANEAEASSDVMMDMYISADDFFSSSDPTDYCPTPVGIPAADFSYFATNGAFDSSINAGTQAGLGVVCAAAGNGFTTLPADTGSVADMCRIISDDSTVSGLDDIAGLLQEGELAMSVTFRLDIDPVCEGTFDQGSFNFVGRVV